MQTILNGVTANSTSVAFACSGATGLQLAGDSVLAGAEIRIWISYVNSDAKFIRSHWRINQQNASKILVIDLPGDYFIKAQVIGAAGTTNVTLYSSQTTEESEESE